MTSAHKVSGSGWNSGSEILILLIVTMLVALKGHSWVWGVDPGGHSADNAWKPSGSYGLQSPERIPTSDILYHAEEIGKGNGSAGSRDAIIGEGFFQILMPDGGLAYTRNGSFKVASDGVVVARDGFELVAIIGRVTLETTGIVLTSHGEVFITTALGSTAVGRITLTRFANPIDLKPIGLDLFIETEASGAPETGNPGENGFGEIGPGFLRPTGSFGFTTQWARARSWIDVEVSQDAITWTVLASGVSSIGQKLYVRDLRAADFMHRFYRMRSKPTPLPPLNGQ